MTRKGAVSARRGELGVIPGSMGAYTLADLKEQTAGVECRKDEGVLDASDFHSAPVAQLA